MAGRIIILSGTSSAGKSGLAKAIRQDMPEPFCYLSTDQLADGDFAPLGRGTAESFHAEMLAFYQGFNRSVAAFADAGCDLIVELVIESQEWADDLSSVLKDHTVLWVWVWVPDDELTRREGARGDRYAGTALKYAHTRHFGPYDLDINTMEPEAKNLLKLTQAWLLLTQPTGSDP
ncbi:chloramphenicol phosphotransferase CPT family protein [Methylobacterium longum]|uniref:Chloramphenicol phosphotransferase CPT family protein n=1 Tax=Methylobacterium longum TaxID=767694 RepID=A0ABT8AK84_9HYPH|nr:chloramphenicol phosphotransferase CPT family protein [Methylobacterium longum]MDN3570153.1 chloramphenicol phosphotransferase CPT family protein [Methylobacterium longum]GJE12228.1 Chloramphenicol 3-O phosphotransferase [Methylobacterium longum]